MRTEPYKVFMGWDSREVLAYKVAENSILRTAKEPYAVQILPLQLGKLFGLLNRPTEMRGNQIWCPISNAPQTTEFSISRFLVPHLTRGWALFCDPDIVCMADIAELFYLADDKYAVMVVKHDYEPEDEIHMVDQVQVKIPRKNWASVILWNCNHPANKKLSLDKINGWPGRDLHAFKWLQDEEIGELPVAWNYLMGVYPTMPGIKLAHFTLGGPWLPGWEGSKVDYIWEAEYKKYKNEPVPQLL